MFSWLVLTSGKCFEYPCPDHPLDKIHKNNLVLIVVFYFAL